MSDPSSRSLVVRAEQDSKTNFAAQQNDDPVVKCLRVEDCLEAVLGLLRVMVAAVLAVVQRGSAIAQLGHTQLAAELARRAQAVGEDGVGPGKME